MSSISFQPNTFTSNTNQAKAGEDSISKKMSPTNTNRAAGGGSEITEKSRKREHRLAGKFRGFDEREGEPLPRLSCIHYPLAVYFMLGNEFCERFSFYGMRAVLTKYFKDSLDFPDNVAAMLFHVFVMVCYATPLIGSILADGYIGRFKVILFGSIVYVGGHIILSGGAMVDNEAGSLALDAIGLFVIACSTGGIKPCVSAFAADQFKNNQRRLQAQFFSFFYFMINLGALISKIVTPLLRTTPCMDRQDCFPLAFGVPAILMFVALVIFIGGKPFFVSCGKSEGFVMGSVAKVIFHGIGHGVCRTRSKGGHWLDCAKEFYDPVLVDNIRGILRVLVLFLPICLFWALFDQQGSNWLLMATRMNGKIGALTILPDQMSVFNPLLIILMIPLFEIAVYPLMNKCKVLRTPLQRITAGCFLAAASFIVAGVIQLLIIQKTMVELPEPGHARLFVSNHLDCSVTIGDLQIKSWDSGKLDLNETGASNLLIERGEDCQTNYTIDTASFSANFTTESKKSYDPPPAYFMAIFKPLQNDSSEARVSYAKFVYEKAGDGNTELIVLSPGETLLEVRNDATDGQKGYHRDRRTVNYDGDQESETGGLVHILVKGLASNIFELKLNSSDGVERILNSSFVAQQGSIRGIVLQRNSKNYSDVELVHANTVPILWLIPQYVIITSGEILLSITGLEFSYSQAAPSMKSVLQAAWLLTVFAGNLIDAIISGAHFVKNPGHELFLYAGLMALVTLVFMLLAYNYEYIDPDDPRMAKPDDSERIVSEADEEGESEDSSEEVIFDSSRKGDWLN